VREIRSGVYLAESAHGGRRKGAACTSGRHEDAAYVVRRSALLLVMGTMLVVPPSGGAYTVADMVFDEPWWRGATADEMTDYKCGDLVTCLKERHGRKQRVRAGL
jgi:hypothetical protein